MHDLIDPMGIIQLIPLVMPLTNLVQLGITTVCGRFHDSLILPASPIISNAHSLSNVLYIINSSKVSYVVFAGGGLNSHFVLFVKIDTFCTIFNLKMKESISSYRNS
ncbi:hypothetical protein VNO80_27027 [Phaseolus coccineus]|uniref:Uncharacterized protein n=1 Tax=Phaseolus coccineus TaxID=3886 RepID=A0AAN9LFS4_PHACN